MATYLHVETRVRLGKALALKGSDLWDVILSFIDAGTLTPTTLRMQSSPDLRLLLPATPQPYASRFDLGTRIGLSKMRDILPIIAEHEAELLANPADVEGIINRHRTQHIAAVQERRVVEAVASLPANEQEIVMYGKRLWPRLPTDTMTYSYDQIRVAIWTFDEYERQLRFVHKDAASRAQLIRLSTNRMTEYFDREPKLNPKKSKARLPKPSGASTRPATPSRKSMP
jgi:hypothetical protein